MDFTLIQQWWTVIAFVFFLGVIVWVFLPRKKADFEEASRLPLEDDDETATTNTAQTRAENSNG